MAERKLHPTTEPYLGPVATAQFVEIGWIRAWPMTWSKAGRNALRNGYGRWKGTEQALPYACETSEHGSAHWPGRRTA